MEIKSIVSEIKKHKKIYEDLIKQLCNIKDGFSYVGREGSYGSNYTSTHYNIYSAVEYLNRYNGDNGWSYINTNNPDILLHMDELQIKFDGEIYYYDTSNIDILEVSRNEMEGVLIKESVY